MFNKLRLPIAIASFLVLSYLALTWAVTPRYGFEVSEEGLKLQQRYRRLQVYEDEGSIVDLGAQKVIATFKTRLVRGKLFSLELKSLENPKETFLFEADLIEGKAPPRQVPGAIDRTPFGKLQGSNQVEKLSVRKFLVSHSWFFGVTTKVPALLLEDVRPSVLVSARQVNSKSSELENSQEKIILNDAGLIESIAEQNNTSRIDYKILRAQ